MFLSIYIYKKETQENAIIAVKTWLHDVNGLLDTYYRLSSLSDNDDNLL